MNTSNYLGGNEMLAMLILVFFMPLVAIIHLIATIYFFNKGHYSSKSFTTKHLAVSAYVSFSRHGFDNF